MSCYNAEMYFKPLPALDYVESWLSYDPDAGIFRWKQLPSNRVQIGDIAGFLNDQGYRLIGIDGITYRAHRLAWLMATGIDSIREIDHVDRDRSNNRFSNLREATHGENHRNRTAQVNNLLGIKGIHWEAARNRYRAQIKLDGKNRFIGRYIRLEDAIAARNQATIELHGEQFGRLSLA